MSEWIWVAMGYGVATTGLAGYLVSLVVRWVRVQHRLDGAEPKAQP